jgi:hypothetical protein
MSSFLKPEIAIVILCGFESIALKFLARSGMNRPAASSGVSRLA